MAAIWGNITVEEVTETWLATMGDAIGSEEEVVKEVFLFLPCLL